MSWILNKKVIVTVILIMAVAGGIFFINRWNRDENRVKRRFQKLLEVVEKTERESLPVAAAKTHKAVSYFTGDAKLVLGQPFPHTLRKPELTHLIQQGRMQAENLTLKCLGSDAMTVNQTNIHLDVSLEGKIRVNGVKDFAIGTYRIDWQETGGKWLISSIEVLEIVSHPHNQTLLR